MEILTIKILKMKDDLLWLIGRRGWISQDQDNGVAAQEHLANEAILVDGLNLFLSFTGSRNLKWVELNDGTSVKSLINSPPSTSL